MEPDTARRIVNAVLNNLNGRAGFDGWWDDIDPETQEEIRESLTMLVQEKADH